MLKKLIQIPTGLLLSFMMIVMKNWGMDTANQLTIGALIALRRGNYELAAMLGKAGSRADHSYWPAYSAWSASLQGMQRPHEATIVLTEALANADAENRADIFEAIERLHQTSTWHG